MAHATYCHGEKSELLAHFCALFQKQLHVTGLPCRNGEEFSLIIPNVPTQGPPTSSAVQVNPGTSGAARHRLPANRVRGATASGSVILFHPFSEFCQMTGVCRRSTRFGLGYVAGPDKLPEGKTMKKMLLAAMLLCPWLAAAELAVAVSPVKITGQKAVVRLEMANNFTTKIDSARAVAFLTDDRGKVLGGANRWVNGGLRGKPGLESGATNAFYFVITSAKPFATTNLAARVTFSRVVLSGGKLADPV